jgi:membrane-associated phospholipid phosphatase
MVAHLGEAALAATTTGAMNAFSFFILPMGTVFMMQKLPGAPIVLGVGLGVAAFTSYLRMAAEQHYLTDVLAGAAIGSLVGWAVPVLFHPPRKGAPQPGALMPTPAGIAIAW